MTEGTLMRLSYDLNLAWLLWTTLIDVFVGLLYVPSGIDSAAFAVITANLLMYAGALMFAVNLRPR